MTNKPTLEPCTLPNCNGEAVFEHPVTEAVVRCAECGLSLTVSYDASIITSYKKGREFERGAVLAQWNTRPAPEPQGFDEWYKSLGDDPSKLGRVILPHDAYNAGYAAAKPKAKSLEWEGYNSGPYEIRVRRGIADLFNHGLRDEDGDPEHLKGGYLTLISLDDLKGIAQAHYQALLDDMGGAQ